MVGYVLIGGLSAKEKYITDFILDKQIASFNLFNFQETLKILQVREIKKTLARNSLSGKNRLFIIRDATIEAQNALLKTLEELPQDTAFIFLNEAILLPTILSRARIIRLESKEISPSDDLSILISDFLGGQINPSSTLLFVDKLFSQNPNTEVDQIVLSFRQVLFEKMKEKDFEKSFFAVKFLKDFNDFLPLIDNNNLNKRLVLERILLKALDKRFKVCI